jgi:hypothetical protein
MQCAAQTCLPLVAHSKIGLNIVTEAAGRCDGHKRMRKAFPQMRHFRAFSSDDVIHQTF